MIKREEIYLNVNDKEVEFIVEFSYQPFERATSEQDEIPEQYELHSLHVCCGPKFSNANWMLDIYHAEIMHILTTTSHG